MKATMRTLRLWALAVVITALIPVAVLPVTASAQTPGGSAATSCGNATFLGFPAWYNGLAKAGADGGCDIMSPNELGGDDGLSRFIWIIVFNVVVMIIRAAGYAAVAFIIYGGYKYMISAGSPDGMVAARKTIMNAVIGLIISIAAVAIVNTISNGLKVTGG